MKKTNKKQDQNKSKKKKIWMIVGASVVGATAIGLSAAALALSVKSNNQLPSVQVEKTTIESQMSGYATAGIHLSEIPKEYAIEVELLNDPTNKVNLDVMHLPYVVDASGNASVYVLLEELPEETIKSKFTLIVKYTNNQGVKRIVETETITFDYEYYGPKKVDALDRSAVKQLPEQILTEENVNDLYFKAVKEDPEIFFNDVISARDILTINSLEMMSIVSDIPFYNFYYSNFNLEEVSEGETTTYYLSFKATRYFEMETVASNVVFTDYCEYHHIPMQVTFASKAPIVTSRTWAVSVIEDKWDADKSYVKYASAIGTEEEPGEIGDPIEIETYADYNDSSFQTSTFCTDISDYFVSGPVAAQVKAAAREDNQFGYNLWTPKFYLGNCHPSELKPIQFTSPIDGLTFDEVNLSNICASDTMFSYRFTLPDNFFGEEEYEKTIKWSLSSTNATVEGTLNCNKYLGYSKTIAVDLGDKAATIVADGGATFKIELGE